MNKTILAHLNHLSAKADQTHPNIWANYKPVSPFKTNKMQRINEKVDVKHISTNEFFKFNKHEELY